MAQKNWNCDGDKCTNPNGEVRVLPLNGDSNLIVCYSCFLNEMRHREYLNQDYVKPRLSKENKWDLPKWESLKVYTTN
jgi:hypothetical protein